MITPAWTEVANLREPPPPAAHAVDLWLVNLDHVSPSVIDTLHEEERRRADRFVFARDAQHFVAARGCLRRILAMYLACTPAEIAFEVGPWGKPAIKRRDDAHLAFNLAHSGGHALIAIGRTESLGVDLEQMRAIDDWRSLVTSVFTPREAQTVLTIGESAQMDAFFACWTRKEAVIKLWGEGLSADLASFEVSADPDTPARILSVTRPNVTTESIALWSFKATSQSWAALAAPSAGGPVELRFWRLV